MEISLVSARAFTETSGTRSILTILNWRPHALVFCFFFLFSPHSPTFFFFPGRMRRERLLPSGHVEGGGCTRED